MIREIWLHMLDSNFCTLEDLRYKSRSHVPVIYGEPAREYLASNEI
jgi:hypothetical protein